MSNDVTHSSCLKPIALHVWLAASSCCKRYRLTSYGLGMKSVYLRTTIQLVRRSGLCTSRYQEATHRSQLLRTRLTFSRSVMVSIAVSTMGMTELIFFELTLGWSERPVLLRCLAVSADVSSNQACRRTLFIHKTICCLRRNLSFLCSLWFSKVR